jgi:rhodanese-related sulfurtransferase
MLVLVSAAAAAGFVANTFGPRRIPWTLDAEQRAVHAARSAGVETVGLVEAAEALRQGSALFVDAREPAAYAVSRIPWSMSVPWRFAGAGVDVASLTPDPNARMIVYCRSVDCDEGLLLARHLQAAGYGRVALLVGGFDAWAAAGLDVDRDAAGETAP